MLSIRNAGRAAAVWMGLALGSACSSSDEVIEVPVDAGGIAITDAGGSPDSGVTSEVPGPPTLTSLVEGDDQAAVVGETVTVRPRVRVTDSEEVPVPGVAVTFTVEIGNGEVEGAVQQTGPDGTAAPTAWRLGPSPGRNQLMGEVPGLAPIFFEATGLADDRGALVIARGNNQNARVSTAVAIRPAVSVTDRSGAPVAGRTVQFRVLEGGGQVEGGTATTDDQGIGEVGDWLLGDTPGLQRLEAATDELPPVVFEALAVSDRAPVLSRQTWISGIGRPWDLAFLPDGTMLISERGGRIRAAAPNAQTTQVILEPPGDLVARGQSGMLGIAVDPDFATNRYIYTFMSSDRTGTTTNHIRRWVLSNDNRALTEDRDILTGMTWDSGGAHSGGRIRFGPQGYLWITTGDVRRATVPQDLTQLGGKVLRITRDGDPAPGNPDLGPTARPEIFFVGVRNPQGIAFRPGSGAPFICEHGPNQDDEVTQIRSGGNGGWNPNDGNGNYNGYTGALMSDPNIDELVLPTFRNPDSAGMCGCDFLVGSQWQAWDGALMVGFLGGTRALVLPINADGSGLAGPPTTVLNEDQRLRSVVQGPDGALYIAVDRSSGEIWRVTAQ